MTARAHLEHTFHEVKTQLGYDPELGYEPVSTPPPSLLLASQEWALPEPAAEPDDLDPADNQVDIAEATRAGADQPAGA